MTWDAHAFPHPAEMQNDIASRGRKMVTIVDPHVKRDYSYYIHKEASDKKYYVKNKDGSEFDGWCWPGGALVLLPCVFVLPRVLCTSCICVASSLLCPILHDT